MVTAMLSALISKEDIKDFGIRNLSSIKILSITIVGILLVVLFVFTIFLPYKKDVLMKKLYVINLPERVTVWKKLNNITPMGDSFDTVLMFSKIQSAYNINAQSIMSADSDFKNAALSEIDEIGLYLENLNKKNPSDYGIRLIASSLDYTKMRITNEFSGTTLERARTNAVKAIELSPTDPQSYWIAGQIELSSGNSVGAKELFERALNLNPKIETSQKFIKQINKI
jgi:tetratricopeptide (TPR) repeat protein